MLSAKKEKMTKKVEPIESRDGKRMDDNIDDLGRKPDGTKLEQPTGKKDKDKETVKSRNPR
jgi:hypothetical protein